MLNHLEHPLYLAPVEHELNQAEEELHEDLLHHVRHFPALEQQAGLEPDQNSVGFLANQFRVEEEELHEEQHQVLDHAPRVEQVDAQQDEPLQVEQLHARGQELHVQEQLVIDGQDVVNEVVEEENEEDLYGQVLVWQNPPRNVESEEREETDTSEDETNEDVARPAPEVSYDTSLPGYHSVSYCVPPDSAIFIRVELLHQNLETVGMINFGENTKQHLSSSVFQLSHLLLLTLIIVFADGITMTVPSTLLTLTVLDRTIANLSMV